MTRWLLLFALFTALTFGLSANSDEGVGVDPFGNPRAAGDAGWLIDPNG